MSLVKYHILTIVPIILILILFVFKIMNVEWFMSLMVLYAFVLRPTIDYYKLISKRLIGKNDFWKCYNPFFRFKFYKELMFEE